MRGAKVTEKRRALIAALTGRTVEGAAELLGLTPRHVYRLKSALLTGLTAPTERQSYSGSEDVTAPPEMSLCASPDAPTFAPVGSTASPAAPEQIELEETKLMLPADIKTWMLTSAAKRRERGQPSMSRVVIELVRAEMARERGGSE